MADIKDFWDTLHGALAEYAEQNLAEMKDAFIADSNDFITRARKDIELWIKFAAAGQLTPDDMEFLIDRRKDLAAMAALQQAGLPADRLERCRNELFGIIVGTAFKIFL